MDDNHRDILRRNRTDLVKDLEPLKLLNDLAECLDEDDRETVKGVSGRKSQAEELLDMIPRKGPKAFECFVAALHKRQQHLARPLIEESGIDVSAFLKDDVGMTSQHKEILLSNVENFREMDLETLVPLLHSAGLLDSSDKEDLLSETKQASQRVDMLLTDILPRKGPSAFKNFVQELQNVHPEMAQKLLQESSEKGSSNGSSTPPPVQEATFYTLNTLVQEILDTRSECLFQFCELMDEEDVWGNGWMMLYKELCLPPGKEERMKGKDGGPTLTCMKGWVSLKGREATVQALLMATNRAERKDCTLCLEKSLGCQLDHVDSGVDDMTRKMELLTSRENRRVEFFGDLDEKEASQILDKFQHEAIQLLRQELIKELGADERSSTLMLIQQSKNYPIRRFTDEVGDEPLREHVIQTLRDVLATHKGVTGPLLPPNKFVRDMLLSDRRKLTTELCGSDSWKFLAQELQVENSYILFLDGRTTNPADEVLRYWEVKSGSTIGALYDKLVKLGFPYIADLL